MSVENKENLTKSGISVQLRTTQKSSEFGSELGNYSANSYDIVFSRMMTAVGTQKAVDVANALGISQQSISSAKAKQKIPAEWYLLIAETTGVSMDWLRTGEGEMMRGATPDAAAAAPSTPERSAQEAPARTCIYNDMEPATPLTQAGRIVTCTDCELVMIPLVEARLSAGNGSFETSADSERRYAFRADFLRRKGNANAMVLMRVAGESMEPDIKDNDVVLVDTANTTPLPGRLYAVAVQDLVYLKMVDASPDKLILSSANPAYAPLEIDARADLHDGIRIIGRAVWVGRELD